MKIPLSEAFELVLKCVRDTNYANTGSKEWEAAQVLEDHAVKGGLASREPLARTRAPDRYIEPGLSYNPATRTYYVRPEDNA